MSIHANPVRAAALAALVLAAATAATPQRARGDTVPGSFQRVQALADLVPGDGAKAVRPRAPETPATLTLAVTVRDGGEAVEVTAAKVAALVEATRDACDWESPEAKLDPHAEAVTSGSDTIVTIVATPGDGAVPRAFLRVAP